MHREINVSDFSITFEPSAGGPFFLPISPRFDPRDITTDKASIRSEGPFLNPLY